ncbi:hypothetical protein DTO021D3_5914 [Paecilomyces variotii]|nr:hypothetical protein DTO032I3_5031 [Paecilomyces variotii]KAJ9277227.1 hypothetical protein DTO021D3_5914 [Paecilomyces variotii]KAJ9339204.1 hypothetical protein DTO027B6_8266 [Paecilomyces variotii]KAJ9381464.1 hypothetical protein DTO063F5_6210 [Paecilomyces variotii]KAJ9382551.1 hypothetical protein DTO032I4_5560 [Paecilomyces variotii]
MVAGLLGSEWNADRIPLRADFEGQAGSFTAVTDGQLQDIMSKRILALVECKRGERDKHSPQVKMQETAEMILWIKEYPDPISRLSRALISQDGDEIYISHAGLQKGG